MGWFDGSPAIVDFISCYVAVVADSSQMLADIDILLDVFQNSKVGVAQEPPKRVWAQKRAGPQLQVLCALVVGKSDDDELVVKILVNQVSDVPLVVFLFLYHIFPIYLYLINLR